MDAFQEYIKPELLILVGVLYASGGILKRSRDVPDRLIPAILGAFSVLLCFLWVVSTGRPQTAFDWMASAFTSIVQGVLIAGQSVYIHQLGHQRRKPSPATKAPASAAVRA